jgi:Flp pilus assembly pilin Flp
MMLRHMRKSIVAIKKWRIWEDCKGQDLIEYALMAGFVSLVAATIMPGIGSSINVLFSKVNSVMLLAVSS